MLLVDCNIQARYVLNFDELIVHCMCGFDNLGSLASSKHVDLTLIQNLVSP